MRAEISRFSQRSLIWLILIGGLSFFGALYLTLFGDNLGSPKQAGANAYSGSAIGHKALVEILRKAGWNATVSRTDSVERARGGLLVLAEPDSSIAARTRLVQLYRSDAALLILPKWRGRPDPGDPGRIASAEMIAESDVQEILSVVDRDSKVVRPEGAGAVPADIEGGFKLVLDRPQLMVSKRIQPIISTADGVLLGRFKVFRFIDVWVLSDPDLINNHGLIKGDNAAIAMSALERGAKKNLGMTIVFDESIHGFEAIRNMWRTLLDPPFVVVALLAVIAALIYLWSAAGRFGAPRREAPALGTGVTVLLANAGEMLRFGDRYGPVLRRYAGSALRDVAAGLRAPRGLDGADLVRWADEMSKTRRADRETYSKLLKTAHDLSAAQARDEKRVLAAARKLHQWKREMLDVRRGH